MLFLLVLEDFMRILDDRVNTSVNEIKRKSRSSVWCCNFCGIADHRYEDCPESKENGKNPNDPFGVKVYCINCYSYNHLVTVCVHTEARGSNLQGKDGKKFMCGVCSSYDHMTRYCPKQHSEKFGRNKIGISGAKLSCDICNSFNHLGFEHGRSVNHVPSCDHCGQFSHSSVNCPQVQPPPPPPPDLTKTDQNRWKNMQTFVPTSNYVEEISEEERQEQIAREKMMMERLKLKSDPNYVPESSRQSAVVNNKEKSPAVTTANEPTAKNVVDGEESLMRTLESGNREHVYTEPDTSVFDDIDLRTSKEQPQISSHMHEKIVSVLTGDQEAVVSDFKIHITKTDLYGLTGENWINDKVVEMYMQLIARRSMQRTYRNLQKPSIYCMSTYFFEKLIKRGYDALHRWTKDVDIFSFDIILIPIHMEDHWCLAVVDFRSPGVFYYDSMAGHNMPALSAILYYLKQEHLKRKGHELELTNFAKEIVKECPQQQNGADCGIFACKVAEYISRDVQVNFSQDDMPYFRKRMIWEIAEKTILMG